MRSDLRPANDGCRVEVGEIRNGEAPAYTQVNSNAPLQIVNKTLRIKVTLRPGASVTQIEYEVYNVTDANYFIAPGIASINFAPAADTTADTVVVFIRLRSRSRMDNLLIDYKTGSSTEGEGESEGEPEGEGEPGPSYEWISETYESATVGTSVLLTNGRSLTADNVWMCQPSWENDAGEDGPELTVMGETGNKYLWQNATADGKGDMVSPPLPPLNINENRITIQFDYITGNTVDTNSRKWYVYAGKGAGNNYSYRVKVQARTTKESLEINLFQDPPTEGGEVVIKDNTKMQPNMRYRIRVTFIKNAAVGKTGGYLQSDKPYNRR